jgi:PAS domain S-box-containing protein
MYLIRQQNNVGDIGKYFENTNEDVLILEHSKAETIGQNVNILMPKEVAVTHDDKVKSYLETGIKHIIGYLRPVTGVRKNGSGIALELKVAEIKLSHTKRWFIAYVRDTEMLITSSEQNKRAKLAMEIFPITIANRISNGERFIHDLHKKVSILFADIVGFTSMSQEMNSASIISMLNTIFTGFDKQLDEDGRLEKIKTIGDCVSNTIPISIAY